MSRFRLFLLTVAAAMALGAVASSSALAEAETKPCKAPGSNRWVFCYHTGLEIGTPPQLVLGISHLSVLATTAAGAEVKIHCPKDDFHGFLELLGKTKGLILFLSCTLEKPAGCKLSSAEIHVKFTDQLIGHPNAAEDEFTGEGVGEEFTSVTIEKQTGLECAAEGVFSITGKQTCKLPEFGTALVVHDIDCKKAGSNLKFGGNVASFSSLALVHLGAPNLGLRWYIDLGI